MFRGDALLSFFYLAAFALTLTVSRSFLRADHNRQVLRWVALALVAIGVVSTGMALVQWLKLWHTIWIHDLPPGARPYANLAQPNNFSTLIWISFFSLYYLFECRCIGRTGLITIGLFLIFGAALAQSRTSWLVLGVVLVSVAIHKGLFRSWRWQRLALPVLVMVAFLTSGLMASWLTGFLFMGEEKPVRVIFSDIRIDMWKAFWQAILEHPWVGYGWGQVSVAQYGVAEFYPTAGLTQYTHNLFLDLFVWNGIPAGLMLIALVCYFWIRLFLGACSSKGFYCFTVYTSLLAHALLEYPHAYAYFLLLSGCFVGFSLALPVDTSCLRTGKRRCLGEWIFALDSWFMREYRISSHILILGLCIFAAFLVVSWRDYRILEEDHRLLRFEVASIGKLKAAQKAPDVFFFDQLQGFIWVARTHEFDHLTDREQQLIENVAKRYALPMPLYKLARLRIAENRKEEALDVLKVIRALHGDHAYDSVKRSLSSFLEQVK